MPFDVLPQTETKVGTFQEYADAMLRGCVGTQQVRGVFTEPGRPNDTACALWAMHRGLGETSDLIGLYTPVRQAYSQRYGTSIERDNDSGIFTREQIAARIAAL